jgi:hypothetical protein
MDISRRQVVALGAVGTAGVLLGRSAPTSASAADSPATGRGVHIHGTVVYRGTPPVGFGPGKTMDEMDASQPMPGMTSTAGPSMGGMARMATTDYLHVINIDVFGPDSDMSGSGWGATADASDPNHPVPVDGLQCFYTQRGSVEGDIVKLTGRMLFSGDPDDPGGTITTEANLANGTIKWTGTLNKMAQFVLEGTGVVMRT